MDPVALGEDEEARLFEHFGREVAAGDVLYRAGDSADRCYIIREGRVRISKRIRNAERSLTVLREGDLFGEDALLDHASRSATASALTDLKVLGLERRTFAALLATNEKVAIRMVQQLVVRLRDAEEQLENAMLKDHSSRIINTLLRLASLEEPDEAGTHTIPITPLDLSTRVGLDVDSVKRAVQELRDGGYLSIDDQNVVLKDLSALQTLYSLLGKKEEVRGGFR